MKYARSRTHGGISIISAFIDGIGGAFSTDVPMTVTVREGTCSQEKKISEDLRRYLSISTCFRFTVESRIPSGYGLKSSSAYILALAKAMVVYSGKDLDDMSILTASAEVSKMSGFSVTGALDDLCQAMYGGYCLTDNRKMRILRHGRLPELPVLVCADGERRSSGTLTVDGHYRNAIRRVEDLAFSGRIFDAAVANGLIYGSMFGMDLGLMNRMMKAGALYSSQSGKGPAIFGIFPDRNSALKARSDIGFGIVTKINNQGIRYWKYDS
ncbi:shikimate kinase [Thermoplasma sp.]|uniref:shikimate kinase n=1 Tax=Thermoplasma sp. TaxID=1973142 RepID=UPI00126B0BBF|nr:shikimate kinase [Thermoplasma sp.]KAA8922742.1 MAG: shikimate kinase [Thermoplasma sp.]